MANGQTRSPLRSRGVQTLIVVVILVTVGIIVIANRKKAPTYFTSPAKVGNLTSVVQATGTVNPIRTISIGAQVSGIITDIYVDFNSKVKKGELLAQLDPRVYQNALDSAKSDLANAEASYQAAVAQVAVSQANVSNSNANVEKAKAALVQATLQKDRTLGLFKQGIVSAAQRDTDVATYQTDVAGLDSAKAQLKQSEAALESSQASVAEAKANVQQRKTAVNTAETNLGYTKIYAPVDGVIINRAVDVGQTVASAFSAPLLFSEATDLKTMWVYVQTDESDEGRLNVGDEADFTVDAYPNTTYHGKVLQRRMNATTVQNVVEYDTIIQFDNAGEKLFPGMTAYVNIPVAKAQNVLEVPNSALRFKPQMSPVELRETLQKYGIDTAAGGGEGAAAHRGSNGGASAEAHGQAGAQHGQHGNHGNEGAMGADASANHPTTALVWTLDANKNLVPVQVRTGITDFTYTAVTKVLHGSLKAGDSVVTGQLVTRQPGLNRF